jgi:hypothetical protein
MLSGDDQGRAAVADWLDRDRVRRVQGHDELARVLAVVAVLVAGEPLDDFLAQLLFHLLGAKIPIFVVVLLADGSHIVVDCIRTTGFVNTII